MKKVVFKILTILLIVSFNSCEEKIKTFKLTLSEGVYIVSNTPLDKNAIPENVQVTVFVNSPEKMMLESFKVNNKEEKLKDGYFSFIMTKPISISAKFIKFYTLTLSDDVFIENPKNLNTKYVIEGQEITLKTEFKGGPAIESFFQDSTLSENIDYYIEDEKMYARATFKMTEDYSVNIKFSDSVSVPPIFAYEIDEDEVTLGRREVVLEYGNVFIPEFVTSIGDEAFRESQNLVSVEIPNSVKSIGDRAFAGCNLINIEIPDSVIELGGGVFSCCSLSSINIPNSVMNIREYTFFECENLSSINIPDSVINIGECAFQECENLSSINIPDSVLNIGGYAFQECLNLSSIIIPDSVSYIGEYAFNNTPWLDNKIASAPNKLVIINDIVIACDLSTTDFSIPENTVSIAAYAFYNSSAENITIPKSVSYIGGNAFKNTPWLDNKIASAPNKLVIINDIVIACDLSTTDFSIPENTVSIADKAFYNSSAENITIPDSVLNIGECAFQNCSNLSSINIPDSVINIREYTFQSCKNLSFINIPDSVTTIGNSAFFGCRGLNSIIIPEEVTSMGSYVFNYCNNLATIYCRASNPSPAAVPDGWDDNWKGNGCTATVVWGYTG